MIYLFWMLGYGFLELQFCDIVHIHLPMNSACLIFQSEVESGGKKAWKQEAGCKLTSTYWSHPLSSSSKEANYYLPNSTTFLNLVIQKTVLLYLCEYTCVEFVWVKSATYVICKEMKQDCQLEKILIDYIVITTYFATGPSYFAICCYFLWKKNNQNFIRLTVNQLKFNTCIWSIRKRLLKLYIAFKDDDCIL